MTETLTESFCERCGTRYEFTAPTRLNPVRKTRGFIGGLKNYLTSQDSLEDSFDDAMRNEAGALATAQLDAFHEAFNFCIDCRQYTCGSCWNDAAGRCRSCVPVPGVDDLTERLAASVATGDAVAETEMTDDDLRRRVGLDAWPTSDLPEEAAANGHVADDDSWATTPGTWTNAPAAPTGEAQEPAAAAAGGFVGADGFVYESQKQADKVAASMLAEAKAAEAAAAAAAELEAQQAAEAAAEAALAAMAADEAALAPAPQKPDATLVAEAADATPVVAETPAEPVQAVEPQAPEPARLHVVAWDEDDVDALAQADEPVAAEVEPEEPAAAEVEPEEPVAAEVEPEPVAAEVEPEPVAAEVEPEEPAPAPPRLAPISETILHFPTRPVEPLGTDSLAAEDDSPELAARRAQLDELGLGGDPTQPDMPAVLPYRSRGAAISAAELAVRAAAGQHFWEASAREVASAVGNVGVQNCGHCGLSLSASARFCRRCGTRQAA